MKQIIEAIQKFADDRAVKSKDAADKVIVEAMKTPPNFKVKFIQPKRPYNVDPYMRFKPEGAPDNGKNILFVSDFQIAGQQRDYMTWINAHTPHRVRFICQHADYINSGYDIVLTQRHDAAEVDMLVKTADIYQVLRGIPEWLENHLTPRNTVLDICGSWFRQNPEKWREMHAKGFTVMNKYEWNLYSNMPEAYSHINIGYPVPRKKPKPDVSWTKGKRPIRIAHSPTKPEKGTTEIFAELYRAQKAGAFKFEPIFIIGMGATEAMEARRKADIFIDKLDRRDIGCPGRSTLESLGLGQIVIADVNNFYMQFYPDFPAYTVDSVTEIVEVISGLLGRPGKAKDMGLKGYDWVRRNYDLDIFCKRLVFLYDQILRGTKRIGVNNAIARFV